MPSPAAFCQAVMLAALAASMTASPVLAQRSTTRGWVLGAHLQGGSLSVDHDDPAGGGGLGIRAGYGVNRHFTPYLEADAIQFDVTNTELGGSWGMTHLDLGLRYSFANSLRRWVPFLETALGVRAVIVDDGTVNGASIGRVTFSGGAFSLGGGVGFYVKQHVAVETLIKFTGGTFQNVDVGDVTVRNLDIEAESTRLKIGVAWWP
jgi:Outer membrane protein beta-barrel domain